MRKAKNRILALALALVMFVSAQFVLGISGAPHIGMPLSVSYREPVDYTAQYQGGGAAFKASETLSFARQKRWINNHAADNEDVKAWLNIQGTNINYPVVYNNEQLTGYYLYRDWKGKNYPINYSNWSQYPDTAIILDYRTRIGDSWATSSRNMVLYGHNWNNLKEPAVIGNQKGYSMFAQLKSYTNLEFARENPHIYFSMGEFEGIWRVFAVGYATTSPNFAYNTPNMTKKQLQYIIDGWRGRSKFDFDVEVTNNDRILTLSTCTRQHGPNDTQRYVVVARLLRPGESEDDKVSVRVNKDIIPFTFNPPPPPDFTASAAAEQAPETTPVP